MTCSLNSLKGAIAEIILGTTIQITNGNTRTFGLPAAMTMSSYLLGGSPIKRIVTSFIPKLTHLLSPTDPPSMTPGTSMNEPPSKPAILRQGPQQ